MATSERTPSEPAPRASLLLDGALAVGLAALVTLGTYFASQDQPARRPFDAGAITLIVIAAGARGRRDVVQAPTSAPAVRTAC